MRARNAGICFALALVVPGVECVATLKDFVLVAAMLYAIALMSTWWSFRKDLKHYLVEVIPGTCMADVDRDGIVGVPDLLTMLAAWGACQ